MFEELRRRRAAGRVKPGSGRPLQRFRWWQQLSRSLFHLYLPGPGGRRTVYAVDVRPMGDRYGGFAAPVQLPLWLTIALGLGAVLASVERALRLRYHWLLDGAAS